MPQYQSFVGRLRVGPVADRLAVTGASVGCHENAGTDQPGPPTQIEIFAAGKGLWVEPAELGEEVGPQEHRGTRHVEDVAHAVVLLLVEFAGLDARVRDTETVDGHPDLEQHLGVVGIDELRPHDPRVRAVRLLDEEADRRRLEGDVVVEEEEEGRAFHGVEGLVRRDGEPDVGLESTDERPGQDGRDPWGRIVVGSGVEDEDREVRVVGVADALERRLEPRAGVVRHHHRNHGRGDENGLGRLRGRRDHGGRGDRGPGDGRVSGLHRAAHHTNCHFVSRVTSACKS